MPTVRMPINNKKIRIAMFDAGIAQWQLAEILGIHEGSLSRKMRHELPAEEQDKIVKMIKEATHNGADK